MRKRSWAVSMTVLLAMLALIAACGGGGGGGGGGAPAGPGALATGGFLKTVDLGGTADWAAPFELHASRTQHLYLASDIKGAGNLTSVSFISNTTMASATTCSNVTIKAGHTLLTGLTVTFASNINSGSPVTVYSGAVTIPALAAGTTYTVTFSQPFYYNGVDNVVLDFVLGSACSQSYIVKSTVAIANTGLYSGSGTSSTGGLWGFSPALMFHFSGGDDAVVFPGGAASGSVPFGTSHMHLQLLYSKDEVNGSGPITGLGFITAGTTTTESYTYSLKLGHTTLSHLTTTFANNYNSGAPVTVVSNGTFTIPGGVPANTYLWIPFPGSFTYNGTDNLVVDIDVATGTKTNNVLYSNVTDTARGASGATGSATAGNGLFAQVIHVVFRFNGGRIMVLPNVATGNSGQVLGSGTAGQIQSVYKNALLGTGGTINNVYVRLSSGSTPTAATLTNYKLYMGLTSKSILTTADTFASNMDGMATVFNGTLTVPAGVKAGDWVKIPLSQAFTYDSGKNLCILFTTDAGPTGNVVNTYVDATLLPVNSVGRNDNAVTTTGVPTWVYDGIVGLALDISK